MENKIKLTPFQYFSYWWVKRMKDFVEDVIKVGYSTDDGVEFTQMFGCLKDANWRALYLKLTPLIEEEFNKNGRFEQSTRCTVNDHYTSHSKINEMLKMIIKLDIPDATLNPTDMLTKTISIGKVGDEIGVYLYNTDDADKIIMKADLNVERDYILTGDRTLLFTDRAKLDTDRT